MLKLKLIHIKKKNRKTQIRETLMRDNYICKSCLQILDPYSPEYICIDKKDETERLKRLVESNCV